jgi:hypothetical protein
MQPAYLPWLGYFDRIYRSDVFIVLDHVQMDQNSKTKFTNRNKIRTSNGWAWLTVPLKTKGKHGEAFINQLEIVDDSGWRQKHWGSLANAYARAPYFKDHKPYFESVYQKPWCLLNDVMSDTFNYFMKSLGLTRTILYSSQLNVAGHKDDLILNLCREVKADVYISGPFGRDYLNAGSFREASIELQFHDYAHPTYRQCYQGFEPFMSIVDLLFNHGPESLAVLTGNKKEEA